MHVRKLMFRLLAVVGDCGLRQVPGRDAGRRPCRPTPTLTLSGSFTPYQTITPTLTATRPSTTPPTWTPLPTVTPTPRTYVGQIRR